MDFSNRGNKPAAQQPATAPQEQNQTVNTDTQRMPNRNSRVTGRMSAGKLSSLFVILGGAILLAALLALLIFGSDNSQNKESDLIKQDNYQAVFLDSQDGQVYFGKLEIYNKDLYALTDIYYVRVENPIQPQGEEPQAPNISLAKLGNELHGPEDVMFVARDKVLYWENLKADGQVVTAISEFKANGGESTNNQQETQPAGTQQQDDTADTDDDAVTPETP